EAPGENSLLRVQTIFRLVKHHRLWAIDYFVGNFLAAVSRQTMHKDRIALRELHQRSIYLIRFEYVVALLAVLVTHRNPGVGHDAVSVSDCVLGIAHELDHRARLLRPIAQHGFRGML